jgi:hypothetical protein
MELSAFDRWQQQSTVVADSEDSFKAFIFAPPSRLPTLEGRQLTVIEWWAQPTQQQTFPALSQLAVDVLSAFARSAESERTFSKARRTTSWERSQLSANTIRCSELSRTGYTVELLTHCQQTTLIAIKIAKVSPRAACLCSNT